MGRGYQKGGYQQHGKGKGRGKGRDDSRLQRNADIESKYNAPPSATSINATAFILCLALYVRGTIEPIVEDLQGLQCFIMFSKWLSWLLRHGRMAGMADGDNRHYGCQKHFCKKAHRYNG